MKTSFLAFLLLCSLAAFGQSETGLTPPRALFKVSPQHFTINTLKIGTEIFDKNRTKSYSIFVYGRFDSNRDDYYYGGGFYRGLGGEFQYRKYISPMKSYTTKRNKNYLRGVYAGGYVQGASYSNDLDYIQRSYDYNTGQFTDRDVNIEQSIANWGTGFVIGFQRTFWEVLYLDVYAGGGIQWADVVTVDRSEPASTTPTNYYTPTYYITDSSISSPSYQGIMPKFGFTLGVTF